MANSTLQAESACTNGTSDTIPSLFAQWADSVRAYAAHPGDGDDPEWCKLLDHADKARARVMHTPAVTVEDMAIKSYLAIRHELGMKRGDFDIDFEGGLMTDDGTHSALIADAVRLSPVLAQLVAREGLHHA